MTRTSLLTAAAVIALTLPAHAEDNAAQGTQTNFQQAVSVIKDWFGKDTSEDAATPVSAMQDEALQVPPMPNPNAIEPAAGGGIDDDILQVPPQYVDVQSNNAPARATAFDARASQSAFNDAAPVATPADLNAISSAAGEDAAAAPAKMDCDAIKKAANGADADSVPDTALIEACEAPQAETTSDGQPKAPAQPAFGTESAPTENPLPGTQPAAGEPPIGGAVMPGEPAKAETKAEVKADAKAKADAPADKPAPAPTPAP